MFTVIIATVAVLAITYSTDPLSDNTLVGAGGEPTSPPAGATYADKIHIPSPLHSVTP
jgi:hypothetical protein